MALSSPVHLIAGAQLYVHCKSCWTIIAEISNNPAAGFKYFVFVCLFLCLKLNLGSSMHRHTMGVRALNP